MSGKRTLVCQRCHAQLTGGDERPAVRERLVDETWRHRVPEVELGHRGDILSREKIEFYEAATGRAAAAGSFVVLPKSATTAQSASTAQSVTAEQVSIDLTRARSIWIVLSGRTDLDLPVCVECADVLLEASDQKLSEVRRERDAYIEYLRHVRQQSTEQEEGGDEEELRQQVAEAEHQLASLETETEAATNELVELEAQAASMEAHEVAEQERLRDTVELALMTDQAELERIQRQMAADTIQLERLRRTNVYNDVFCIGHDGHFGTINGLRLGRLPGHRVDWSEINAAWGLAALLLDTVAHKLDFEFSGYRLRPLGSTSAIIKFDPTTTSAAEAEAVAYHDLLVAGSASASTPGSTSTQPRHRAGISVLELYTSGDLTQRLFLHRKFDYAMVSLLDCLAQLGAHVEEQVRDEPGKAGKLPYRIDRDRIGDSCIRLAFNQDEIWTRACKFVLTDMKWILAVCSSRSRPR